MKSFWIIIGTLCVLFIIAFVFAISGIYNISARTPHFASTEIFLEFVRNRSIANHSSELKILPPDEPGLAMTGVIHFDATCRKCHGAPGQSQEEFAQGLYPVPPSLKIAEEKLSREEIFWVISNGLKMTGMPAFGMNHEKKEIAGMVAFIGELPALDNQNYIRLVDEATSRHGTENHHHNVESLPSTPKQDIHEHEDGDKRNHH